MFKRTYLTCLITYRFFSLTLVFLLHKYGVEQTLTILYAVDFTSTEVHTTNGNMSNNLYCIDKSRHSASIQVYQFRNYNYNQTGHANLSNDILWHICGANSDANGTCIC